MSTTTTIASPVQGEAPAPPAAVVPAEPESTEQVLVVEPEPPQAPTDTQASEGSSLIGQVPPTGGSPGSVVQEPVPESEPEPEPAPTPDPVVRDSSPPPSPESSPPGSGSPVQQHEPAPLPEPVKPEPVKPEPVKPEPVKPEPVKPEPVKPEPVKPEPARPQPVTQQPVTQQPPVVQQPVVQHPRPRRPRPRPTPVQHTPVQQTPIQTGGGTPTSSIVRLGNRDRNSSVRLQSDRGTMVEIYGDPHVRAMVNGVRRNFDIGYGPGSITLRDGTKISWDTYPNRSRALRNFAIDAPGRGRDNRVSTADGVDVRNQLTNLTDAQLREFIAKLSEFRGSWRSPLRRRPGTAIDTSPNPGGEARARHVVKRGDTLWAIATKAGLTVEQVARFNGIRNPDLIHPGQVIRLPG